VFRFLEVELPDSVALGLPTLRRQADELSEAWVQRYLAQDR
jgi:hypothetical protein